MRIPLVVTLLALSLIAGCGGGTPPADPNALPAETEPVVTATPACDANFKAYDKNADGVMSYDEYIDGEYGKLRFVRAPSEAEVLEMKSLMKQEAEDADQDKNGSVSREEYMDYCVGLAPPEASEEPAPTDAPEATPSP
jgi:hypothetical protein